MASVVIRSKAPYLHDGAFAGLMCHVDIETPDCVRSGPQVVDVPEDAADNTIRAVVLALYGLED